jgi:hypothetical protein
LLAPEQVADPQSASLLLLLCLVMLQGLSQKRLHQESLLGFVQCLPDSLLLLPLLPLLLAVHQSS